MCCLNEICNKKYDGFGMIILNAKSEYVCDVDCKDAYEMQSGNLFDEVNRDTSNDGWSLKNKIARKGLACNINNHSIISVSFVANPVNVRCIYGGVSE